MVGITLGNETSVKKNLLYLVEFEEGNWIDIGTPLKEGESFPVTVKILVFNRDEKNL